QPSGRVMIARAGPAATSSGIAPATSSTVSNSRPTSSSASTRFGAIPELVAAGPARAIITLPDGCVAGLDGPDGEVLVRASIESLEARSRGGAGAAVVAGYVAGRHRGLDPRACLALGVACGAESTQHFGAGIVDPHEAERLASEVELEEVGSPASTI
ncbi:MAG: PfkB family carbohydrate kinase, partial [Solirubrobacterales bacterium]